MPNDGGGDKRCWSLRGSILYPVLSEHGKVLAWVGRDVQHEQKEREYQQLSPADRSGNVPPAKHPSQRDSNFNSGVMNVATPTSGAATRRKCWGSSSFEHGCDLTPG
ncbi:MAG: hypothetical protein ABI614_10340 [Planctomycetota bacterium]